MRVVATLFQIWAFFSAGLKYNLLLTLLFVPGIFVYIQAQKEQGRSKNIFSNFEKMVVGLIFVGSVAALYFLVTGVIAI